MTPTQRTLRELRKRGYKTGVVERWLRYAGSFGKRQDLFGIIDIIAISRITGVLGVQCCGGSFAAHYRKLTEEKRQDTFDWLSTPFCRLELWSWRKVKMKRKGKAMVWRPRIVEITLEDLE